MRRTKVLVLVAAFAGVIALASFTVRYMAVRSISHADFSPLTKAVEASAGRTLARGDVPLKPLAAEPGPSASLTSSGTTEGLQTKQRAEGSLDYYSSHPEALKSDTAFFKTWRAALVIARSRTGKSAGGRNVWISSRAARWIPSKYRVDGWRNYFCSGSQSDLSIVVDPGPKAMASLDCATITLRGVNLAGLPRGRLVPTPSGALVLVLGK